MKYHFTNSFGVPLLIGIEREKPGVVSPPIQETATAGGGIAQREVEAPTEPPKPPLALIGWRGAGSHGDYASRFIHEAHEAIGQTLSFLIWLRRPTPSEASALRPALGADGAEYDACPSIPFDSL